MAEAKVWVMIPKSDKKAMEIVIDMHPLILCKDCKYHDEENGENFCDCGNRPDDWFCADGIAKDTNVPNK